ncbi:MAG TPA: autotransporter domain-containing protein, partial [Bordetella sp.]|nr:autotransporter domain-containing protein [Bordetella sp.]
RIVICGRPLYAALVAVGLASIAMPALAQVCPLADPAACAAPGGGVGASGRAGVGGAGNGQGGAAVNVSGGFIPIPGQSAVNGIGGDGAAGEAAGGPGGTAGDNTVPTGVRGQDGTDDIRAPGGGGGGGAGLFLNTSSIVLPGLGDVKGGDGGNGGNPAATASGGAGGGGGGTGLASVWADGFILIVPTNSSITGGAGGHGGENTGLATLGGGGGGGGDGVLLFGTNANVANNGSITGGAGGAGGFNGGLDGASGAGIRALATGLTVINSGTISGANGTGAGTAGVGVITQGDATINNTGTLQGGMGAAGRAAAVLFNGTGNILSLSIGSQIQGVVEVGIDADGAVSNNVNAIIDGATLDGGTAQLRLQPGLSTTLDLGAAITGTGNVTSTGSGSVLLRGVDIDGTLTLGNTGGVQMVGPTHTTDLQHYTVPVTLVAGASTVTSDAASLTFDQTINGAQALDLEAPDGTATVTGAIGAITPLTSLTVNAHALSLGSSVATGSLSLTTASGDIAQHGVYSVTGATSLTANGGDVILGNTSNNFGGDVQVTANNATIRAQGDLTLTSVNVAGDITLESATGTLTTPAGGMSTTGAISLAGAQIDAGTLSANAITLNSDLGLTLNNDITATTTLDLESSGVATQAGGAITADTLTATLGGGLTLNSAANAINKIGDLTAQDVSLANSVGLTIAGTVNVRSLAIDDAAGVIVTGSVTATNGLQVPAGTTLAVGNGTAVGTLSADAAVDGSLIFNRNDSVTFSKTLSGSGNLLQNGSGTLLFDGDGSAFTGNTTVQRGQLVVGSTAGSTAVLGGNVSVTTGTSLAGHGRIAGNATLDSGATLSPGNSIGTLTIDGDLSMANGTRMDVELGTPGVGDNVSVGGNLRLDGVTVDVSNAGGMAPGVYNIFSYVGNLLNNAISLGTTPAGQTLQLQILTGAKQINILDGTALQFWNANGLADSTRMGGGDGTWSTTAPVWANADGSATGIMSPQPGFAVFGGTAGLVTVDNAGVQATGMQFLTDGYRLTGGSVDLTTSGDPVYIRVGDNSVASAGYTATIDSILTGSQGFTKMDAGTLVLNGANTYTGTTSIAGGTLAVSDDGNLGNAANGIVLQGGALRITGTSYTATNRALSLQPGGAIDIADASNTFTWQSAITGSGALEKRGAGTLVLTAANTYGGGTLVSGGTLRVGDGATNGSITGDVNIGSNATLAFDRTDAVAFGGAISGAGALQKLGAGTLTLTGANTYSGGTTINAGMLVGSASSLQGNIANNAALVFDQAADGAYTGVLSGNGSVAKQGAGTLTLSGDSGAFAGSTQLSAGGLQVDGSLGGQLTAMAGTTLSGSGTVGDTIIGSNATLSPGSAATPIGTLNVKGNLTFAPGSIYKVDTTIAGAHDSVHATGTANLAGSVVDIGENGSYSASTSYTILTADGGVHGTFDEVSSNLAFLAPSLVYGANDVDLLMQLKGGGSMRFADLAHTGNQRATADGLQSLPTSNALYTRVLNLPNGSPPAVFDSLSGEIHPSTTSILQGVADNVASLPLAHLRANLDAGQLPGVPTAQLGSRDASALPRSAAQPVWAQVFGNWRTIGGTGNTAKVEDTDSGLFIGGDRGVGHGWRVGGALGYTNSDIDLHDRASNSNVDSYSAALYGGKAFEAGPGKINLSLGAAYTWHDIRTKRDADAAGQNETLKADYNASTAQVFTELGYALPLNDRVTLEPFVGANYSDLRTRGFSESGGDAALSGDSDSNKIAATTLGLHARTTFESAGAQGSLDSTLGWRHAFGDVTPRTSMAFDGGQSFTVAGAPIARDAVVLQLVVNMAVSKHTTVGVAYTGQFGDRNQQNAGTLDVRYSF